MLETAGGILLAVAALYGLARFGVAWIGPALALGFTFAVLVWAVVS